MLKWKKTELAMSTMSNKILVINTEWKKPCFIILALGRHKYQLVPTILIVVCLFALYNLFPISQPTPYILIIWLCSCLHLQILLAKGKHFPVSSCRLKNMDELLCHGTVGGIWLKKKDISSMILRTNWGAILLMETWNVSVWYYGSKIEDLKMID